MRITEVRDGSIKIESAEKLFPSSFLKISDSDRTYIAQIFQIKNAGSVYCVYAKPIALYNDAIFDYDGTIPSNRSEVESFDFKSVNESFELKNPIAPFKFIDESYIKLDKSFLESLLISVDNSKTINTLAKNIFKQTKKVLFIDLVGNFESEKCFAGKDFRLPLNKDTLAFLYEDCLNDATSESKNTIKDLFRDLAEYSKSVPFLPFDTLKTIVDDMVEKEHIFKLLVLKNKLAKFKSLGYFAGNQAEVENIKEILNSEKIVIDLSKLDSAFQNRFLEYIYAIAEKSETKPLIFVNTSNLISKKNLKNIILNPELKSILITSARFKYINEIKPMFKNFIIEPSFINNENFRSLAGLLASAPKNCALFAGIASNKLPLIFNIEEVEFEAVEEQTPDIAELSSEEAAAQKSEELIEHLAEEAVVIDETENLFDNSDDDSETANTAAEIEQEPFADEVPDEEDLTEPSDEDFEEIAVSDESEEYKESEEAQEAQEAQKTYEYVSDSFNQETDFHTNIDNTKIIEVPADEEEVTEDFDSISLSEEDLESIKVADETPYETVPQEIEAENEITEEIPAEDSTINETSDIPDTDEASYEEEQKETADSENNDDSDFDEIVELDENELSEDDIIVDLTEDEISAEETLDKEITEDVDKVFNTVKDENISDEDLDLIDELNNELDNTEVIELSEEDNSLTESTEELPELQELDENSDFLEPLEEVSDSQNETIQEKEILETRDSSTPMVPVYDAEIPQEDRVVSDPIEQGDTVVHTKYGTGVVEKMIKYGNKNLYSVNFDNVGRRLLDPTLTELKKA